MDKCTIEGSTKSVGAVDVGAQMALKAVAADGYRDRPLKLGSLMPYKANEPRRHKIPKARYKIENWAEYDAALRRRGSLTVWVTPEAIVAWTPDRAPGPTANLLRRGGGSRVDA